jgi:prevent-host-death family protein
MYKRSYIGIELMNAFSSRDFNQDTGRAKKAAERGPVVITDRGRPAFVLMTYADYESLRGPELSIAEALAMPEGGDLEIEFPRVSLPFRDVDFD